MENAIWPKPYATDESGKVLCPDTKWLVLSEYRGMNEKGKMEIDPKITLVLNDKKKRFWAVISKMSNEEAIELREQLDKVIKEKLNEEK